MPARKGLLAPQNTFLDTIATRFDGTHSNFVLGNAKIAGIFPIVYCSDGFCDLTGYSRAQIMQKSCACNFLYGQKTDVPHKEAISRALEGKEELKLEVILYKSSGTPFWCLLDIVPIQDEKHEVVLFLCSHKDITKHKLHEQQKDQLAQLHAQQQQQVASGGGVVSNAGAGQADGTEELTALANQNALMSMDEFGLEDANVEQDSDELDEVEGDQDKNTAGLYSRRRSRAVLYQLSGHYGGDRRNVNMKSKLKSRLAAIPEYKPSAIDKQWFILSHYGLGKSCWDWLILVVSFYVAIVVPYNATFKDKKQETGECQIDSIDILVEVVFVIDVILNFRTTFVNRKGEVVTKPQSICKHYVRGWFIVDACAALPFDLLCGLKQYSRSRLDLNLLKLVRLLRLARLLQKMDRYSQYSYIILTLLMLIFSLLAHWCACIWYVIAMEEIERNPVGWKIGWLHQLGERLGYSVVNATDMASSYVTALYFTTSSLTSVGFGNVSANTNAEKIFSIVIMLIGALMHAVVFGNVTALIRVMYARRSNYQTRLRDLKDFFRLHQLPKELQQRMSDYFQTTWSLNHGIETYEILKDFPEELRGDVSLHLHREVLSLPIFATAPQGFLKSLARHIESKFCCPTEFLIHRGDALSYLYLVCNGSMEVLHDNMLVVILGKGDLVGYDINAVLSSDDYGQQMNKKSTVGLVKSSSDLKALTYCDLKCIQIQGLLDVLKLYPEFSDTFKSEIINDLSFDLRETHDEQASNDADLISPTSDFGGDFGGRGNGGNGRRSPPANMGHLYRSITANDENQIGRYDDDDDEIGNEDDDDEEEEEEEDEDEEEEEEEEEEDDDGKGAGPKPDGGGDSSGAGGGTSSDTRRISSGSSDSNRGNDEGPGCSKSNGTSRSGNMMELRSLQNWQPSSVSSEEGVARARGSTRRSVRRICRGQTEGDWPSSYKKGLIKNNSISKNSSNETVLDISESKPAGLRPAIGRVNSIHMAPNRKPPLSFDLSRNTTALVDRRRRSAGCIPRPLLVGVPQHAHHSLTHIHEDQTDSPKMFGALDYDRESKRGNQLRDISIKQRRGSLKSNFHRLSSTNSLSNQDVKNIDERLTGLAGNVKEMNLELRKELSEFRNAMKLLMQLVGRQSSLTSNHFNQSSTSSQTQVESAASAAAAVDGNGKGSRSVSNGDPSILETPLLRSRSASSLRTSKLMPEKSTAQSTSLKCQLPFELRKQNILHEESEADNEEPTTTTGQSDNKLFDSLTFIKESATKQTVISANAKQQRPKIISGAQVNWQTDQQTLMANKKSSNSQSNLCTNSNNSDNDSGRSSSSVNSSTFFANRASTSNESHASRLVYTQTAPDYHALEVSCEPGVYSRVGRPAKMLVKTNVEPDEAAKLQSMESLKDIDLKRKSQTIARDDRLNSSIV